MSDSDPELDMCSFPMMTVIFKQLIFERLLLQVLPWPGQVQALGLKISLQII